jgi:hypothetical protein
MAIVFTAELGRTFVTDLKNRGGGLTNRGAWGTPAQAIVGDVGSRNATQKPAQLTGGYILPSYLPY